MERNLYPRVDPVSLERVVLASQPAGAALLLDAAVVGFMQGNNSFRTRPRNF